MKRFFLFLTIIFCFQVSKAQPENDKQSVNETIVKFFEGFSNRDINTIKKYSTHDFLLLEDAMNWNIDTIAKRFEQLKASGINFIRVNSFDFIRTEIKDNTAWVAYYNTANISRADKKVTIKWLESAVLVRQGKEWRIQMMHSTPEKKKE